MDRPWSRGGQGIGGKDAKAVGVFGGSFDPPHLGHEALVEEALARLPIDEVWVFPAGIPPHRRLSGHASCADRLRWLRRMFAHLDRVCILDWECRRAEVTPTIYTLRRLHKTYPEHRFLLLLGADAFSAIETWVAYPEHKALCDVAVFPRLGWSGRWPSGWEEVDVDAWRAKPGSGRVICVNACLPEISATSIRALAASGRSLAGLVPESIRKEVEQKYGGKRER